MFVSGAVDGKIDAKHRVAIPNVFRMRINHDTDGRAFYVLPGRRMGTLALYPDRYYEQHRRRPAPRDSDPDVVHEWREFELSQTYLLEQDGQGRVLIPGELLRRTGLGSEVKLVGVGDHIQIWRRDDYEGFIRGRWPEYPQQRERAAKIYDQPGHNGEAPSGHDGGASADEGGPA